MKSRTRPDDPEDTLIPPHRDDNAGKEPEILGPLFSVLVAALVVLLLIALCIALKNAH